MNLGAPSINIGNASVRKAILRDIQACYCGPINRIQNIAASTGKSFLIDQENAKWSENITIATAAASVVSWS